MPLRLLPSQASSAESLTPPLHVFCPACGSVHDGKPVDPADQSVDGSAGPSDAARETQRPRETSGASAWLLKSSRQRAGGLLADLFGFRADRRPEAKMNGLNLYEPMRRRYGNRTRLLPPHDSAANYDKCLKCRAERCRPPPPPPPRVRPADVSARSGPMKTQQPRCQTPSEGSQSQDGPCGGEGKGLLKASSLSLLTPLCVESPLCSFLLCFHQ